MEKKWYTHKQIIQLNGEEYIIDDYSNSYYYLSEEEKNKLTQTRQVYNFEYAKVCSQDNMEYYMVYKPKTWYRKKEKIGFRLAKCWKEGHLWLTKEKFKSYLIYDKFIPLEVSTYYSLEEIMRHSSADDFTNYMKDKGMTICPMIK